MGEVAPQMTYRDLNTSMLARSTVRRSSSCDSELDLTKTSAQSNGSFVLILRIAFVQPSIAAGQKLKDGDDEDFTFLGRMPEARFNEMAKKLAAQLTAFWKEKMWLETPANLGLFDIPGEGGRFYRPNLHCGFRCEAVSGTATGVGAAHATVEIVHVQEPNNKKHSFRIFDKRWPLSRLGTVTVGFPEVSKQTFRQFTPAHEVGHLLGLDHIGELVGDGECTTKKAASSSGGNHAMCYLAPSSAAWAKHNIMGMGNHVHAVNGGPWLKAVGDHLPKHFFDERAWNATTVRPAPREFFKTEATVFPKAENTYTIRSRSAR